MSCSLRYDQKYTKDSRGAQYKRQQGGGQYTMMISRGGHQGHVPLVPPPVSAACMYTRTSTMVALKIAPRIDNLLSFLAQLPFNNSVFPSPLVRVIPSDHTVPLMRSQRACCRILKIVGELCARMFTRGDRGQDCY